METTLNRVGFHHADTKNQEKLKNDTNRISCLDTSKNGLSNSK
jgi:hypothetical protein